MGSKRQNILVVGSGGVGTISALNLSFNDDVDSTLVIRSQYDQVVESGFTIRSRGFGNISNWRPKRIARSVEEAFKDYGPFDFIIVTTKNIPDGQASCEDIIRPAVTDESAILLIQNGIEIEKPMIEEYSQNVILSGVSLVGSSNNNCVIENSHKEEVFIGGFHNPNISEEKTSQKLKEFIDIYQDSEGRNKVVLDTNVLKTRWEKLIYNAVFNPITAIVNMDINRCQIVNANETLFRPAMKEITEIAASEGINISEDVPNRYLHIGDGLFYAPSMCVDVRKKQLFELEVIIGNPLKVAKRNGVTAPTLSVIYHLLELIHNRIKEEKGLVKVIEDHYKGKNSDNFPSIFASDN